MGSRSPTQVRCRAWPSSTRAAASLATSAATAAAISRPGRPTGNTSSPIPRRGTAIRTPCRSRWRPAARWRSPRRARRGSDASHPTSAGCRSLNGRNPTVSGGHRSFPLGIAHRRRRPSSCHGRPEFGRRDGVVRGRTDTLFRLGSGRLPLPLHRLVRSGGRQGNGHTVAAATPARYWPHHDRHPRTAGPYRRRRRPSRVLAQGCRGERLVADAARDDRQPARSGGPLNPRRRGRRAHDKPVGQRDRRRGHRVVGEDRQQQLDRAFADLAHRLRDRRQRRLV